MGQKKRTVLADGPEQENRRYYKAAHLSVQDIFDAFQAGVRFERQRIVDVFGLDPAHRELYFQLVSTQRGVE